LLAQDYTIAEACILGVFIHGLAGDLAASEYSEISMKAGDIIEQIGAAFKKLTSN
jgi:NAD(P)H-hydrate epimerase